MHRSVSAEPACAEQLIVFFVHASLILRPQKITYTEERQIGETRMNGQRPLVCVPRGGSQFSCEGE